MNTLSNHLPYSIIGLIEPYTRRVQPKELLDDITSFSFTFEQVRESFVNMMVIKYKKDHLSNYPSTFDELNHEFYGQFTKGLYVMDQEHIVFLYYKHCGDLITICRLYWGKLKDTERKQKVISVSIFFHRLLYRPGEAIYPEI